MDYVQAWKARKIQLIIVNIICAIIGVWAGLSYGNIFAGLIMWILGAWVVGTIVASFTKTGDKISTLVFSVGAAFFAGMLGAAFEGRSAELFAIVFLWNFFKACIGLMILGVILCFEFVVFPVTTIVYFVKSRHQMVTV